jgi:hypothetical protein
MKSRKILIYIWFPISIVLNAISLINLQKDLFPALISWKNFFIDYFHAVQDIKNFLFTPLIKLFLIVDISLPNWLTTYLFFSFIVFSASIWTAKSLDDRVTLRELKNPFWVIFYATLAPPLIIFAIMEPVKRKFGYVMVGYTCIIFIVAGLIFLLNSVIGA